MHDLGQQLLNWIAEINEILWGPWTPFVLLGAGVLFTIWGIAYRFHQFKILRHGYHVVRGEYDNPDDPGAINHFQALAAALSATIGLGNIGGVALAIGVGGPGALFWMWLVGFFGIALKTVEIALTMLYRNSDDPDDPHGGAMWVIEKTLGRQGGARFALAKGLGGFFCVSCLVMTMTGGNMFQSWNVAELANSYFGINPVVVGIVLAVLVGLVIIGGIKRIGHVAGKLVPLMCVLYLFAAFVVLAMHVTEIPGMIALIFSSAFSTTAAGGAFLGGGLMIAFNQGLQRGVFSNEAGLGSAPIAHAAAKTDQPVREGVVGGLGPLVDTLGICTLTALVIISTGAWNRGPEGTMDGEVKLETVNGTPTLTAPTDLEAMPELSAHESYRAGQQVFFMLSVPDSENSDRNRVRLFGEIVANEKGRPVSVDWETWPEVVDRKGWNSSPSDVRFAVGPEGEPQTGVYRDFKGASLTAHAFDREFPGLGQWLITLAAGLFALSTMISWSYYGEQAVYYLFGRLGILPYKFVFLIAVIIGTVWVQTDQQLIDMINIGLGFMLWANMLIVLTMGFLAMRALRDYFRRLDAGEFTRHAPTKVTDLVEDHNTDR